MVGGKSWTISSSGPDLKDDKEEPIPKSMQFLKEQMQFLKEQMENVVPVLRRVEAAKGTGKLAIIPILSYQPGCHSST